MEKFQEKQKVLQTLIWAILKVQLFLKYPFLFNTLEII